MDGQQIERLTLELFPEQVWKALTKAVCLARRSAWEKTYKQRARTEAENIYGVEARADVEEQLRGVAERFKLEHDTVRPDGQGWNHVEVYSGTGVLTASRVDVPGGMVDLSEYRRGLATGAKQERLFEVDDRTPPPDQRYYVILAHSRYRGVDYDDLQKNGHLPGSVYLVWPDANCQAYVHAVDLLERFPDVVRQYVPQDWNEAAFIRYLALCHRSAFACG